MIKVMRSDGSACCSMAHFEIAGTCVMNFLIMLNSCRENARNGSTYRSGGSNKEIP